MYRGERIPNAYEQWALAKSMKRTFLADHNTLAKRNLIYESDEDSEDDAEDNAELEGVEDMGPESDDEDGPKKPMTE